MKERERERATERREREREKERKDRGRESVREWGDKEQTGQRLSQHHIFFYIEYKSNVSMAHRSENSFAYPLLISHTSKSQVVCLITFLVVQATGEEQRGYTLSECETGMDRINVTSVMQSLSL